LSSKDSLALAVPLQRMSSTLLDVKKNGETLMLTAQTHLQSMKEKQSNWLSASSKGSSLHDDVSLLGRMVSAERKRANMKRSVSDSSFQRLQSRWLHSRGRPTGAVEPAQQDERSPKQTDSRDWLKALNETLNQARTAAQPKLKLPVLEMLPVSAGGRPHLFIVQLSSDCASAMLLLSNALHSFLQAPDHQPPFIAALFF
jgi:hypothetical protein